jgi:hypothetical protein
MEYTVLMDLHFPSHSNKPAIFSQVAPFNLILLFEFVSDIILPFPRSTPYPVVELHLAALAAASKYSLSQA